MASVPTTTASNASPPSTEPAATQSVPTEAQRNPNELLIPRAIRVRHGNPFINPLPGDTLELDLIPNRKHRRAAEREQKRQAKLLRKVKNKAKAKASPG